MNPQGNPQGNTQGQSAPAPDPAVQEALALHREGKHELAMQRYVGILQQNPANVDVLYYVAMLALQQEQIAEGLKVIQRALDISPDQARLYNLQGQAHLRQHKDDEALQSFGRAIEADPAFPDAYGNRGTLLSEMGRAADALTDFDRALALRPDNPEDHCNRASALADLGQFDAALEGFSRAIELLPSMTPAFVNRSEILVRMGRQAEALSDCDQAIKLYPEFAAAHCQRGVVLKVLGRLDEARQSLDRALELDPKLSDVFANRANIAFEQGRLGDAEADYQRALEARPNLIEASYGLALNCLAQGDWETGFGLYEVREELKDPPYDPLPYPRWTEDAPTSDRLVLLCEQGLGDMIQFARFAPMFAARGIDVTLQAPESMRPLLSTLKGVTVTGIDATGGVNGKPVHWLPLMSAPAVFNVRPDNVPAEVPYLAANPERVERWEEWLGRDGFKIGINWGLGLARTWFAHRRDVPLDALAPLAEIPGVRLISLQQGLPMQQLASVPFGDKIEIPSADTSPATESFLDAAALMTKLDLVVTCDTSLAHLAGALARPVFTALPLVPDWRWLKDREDTPWYPTMRLFRQTTPESWNDVFERIAAAAAEMASAQKH